MEKPCPASIPLLAACALLSSAAAVPARAQVADAEAFMKCAAESVASRRLACFDRVAREQAPGIDETEPNVTDAPVETAAADNPTAPVAAHPAAAVEARPPAADLQVVPAAAPAAVAITKSPVPDAAPPAAVAADPAPAGAMTTTPADDRALPADEELLVGPPQEASGEFTAIVSRVAEQPRGEHVVYLDNGQVWQENVRNSYFPVEAGDKVTMAKRRFGGYRLVTASGRSYKVKRLR